MSFRFACHLAGLFRRDKAAAKKQGDAADKKRREMEKGLAEVASKRAEAEAEVDRLKREKAAQVIQAFLQNTTEIRVFTPLFAPIFNRPSRRV